jgi:malate/lactate dehydrogenase
MSKITIIGAGSVGATIANDLMVQGTASEIILIDVNKEKALGEAMEPLGYPISKASWACPEEAEGEAPIRTR